MNKAMVRMLFTGGFATLALGGALGLEFCGQDVPSWLVAVVAASVGYLFGHVQENGINGAKPH